MLGPAEPPTAGDYDRRLGQFRPAALRFHDPVDDLRAVLVELARDPSRDTPTVGDARNEGRLTI